MNSDLVSERFIYKETDVLIKADSRSAIEAARKSLLEHRNALERYIARNPIFMTTLEPIEADADAPKVVRMMAEAARVADVGPMAAVAGTLAQLAVEGAVAAGAKNIVVENGGDIFIHGNRSYTIAIHASESPLSNKLALEIGAARLPLAVCTSSATVGPSLSFGEADAVTVLAKSGALADAAATAICNETCGGPEEAIKSGISRAKSIPEVAAVVIIHGKHLGSWGDLPKIMVVDKLSEKLLERIQL